VCALKGIIVEHFALDVTANLAVTPQMVPSVFPRFYLLRLPELWSCAAFFGTAVSKLF